LTQLHEYHVRSVPFENLDVHYKRLFDLNLEHIYQKVVVNVRGGFCYELNTLFNALLCDIGYKSHLIAARIFNDDGSLGPKYDHTAIFVETEKQYLADVGFGDLFLKPLEIKEGIQSDGRNLFKIEPFDTDNFVLSMCTDRVSFRKKYIFNLEEVPISAFEAICLDKQINPLSYFVKNMVCTKPTSAGRLTLFNNKLIEKKGDEKIEQWIKNDDELRTILKNVFGVTVKSF
jgi:N-hydroxyarylamine O-acetyltransferase